VLIGQSKYSKQTDSTLRAKMINGGSPSVERRIWMIMMVSISMSMRVCENIESEWEKMLFCFYCKSFISFIKHFYKYLFSYILWANEWHFFLLYLTTNSSANCTLKLYKTVSVLTMLTIITLWIHQYLSFKT
jgi:hypothetical protein